MTGAWSEFFGSDFIQDNEYSTIDFSTVHSYPDSWAPFTWFCNVPPGCGEWDENQKLDFNSKWINIHIKLSMEVLNKPLIVTEFGKWPFWGIDKREALFQQV